MNAMEWMRRRSFRPKKNPVIWLFAGVVALFVLVSMPLVSTSFAKYAASGTLEAGARVAKWRVEMVVDDVPVDEEEIIADTPFSANDDATIGSKVHSLVLFFKGLTSAGTPVTEMDGGTAVPKKSAFSVKFKNDSEVSAIFVPTFSAKKGNPAVKFYKTFSGGTYSGEILTSGSTAGVVLPPNSELLVYVVIADSTFTDLKIGAHCEQVN